MRYQDKPFENRVADDVVAHEARFLTKYPDIKAL